MTFEERTLSSEIVYKGKILNLRRDKVEVVGGRISEREIIEHNGGVAIVAITPENKVVMVKQYRKAVEKVMLEVPAGKIEKGEDPLMTAIRELKEETGFSAKNLRLLTKYFPTVGYSQETIYIFLCTDLTPGDTDFDDNEAIDSYEYDLDQLKQMALAGKIEDGKTLAAILLTVALKEKEGLL